MEKDDLHPCLSVFILQLISLLVAQNLTYRFQEEVLAPHYALIHAQPFALMVHPVLEHAFPAGVLVARNSGPVSVSMMRSA